MKAFYTVGITKEEIQEYLHVPAIRKGESNIRSQNPNIGSDPSAKPNNVNLNKNVDSFFEDGGDVSITFG